jgi:uncharacterized protein YkwD
MRTTTQLINTIMVGIFLLILPNKFLAQTTVPVSCTTVLADINAYRLAHGLTKLQLNSDISQLARNHSEMMAAHKIEFGHGGFSNRTHELYALFPRAQGMAENVAYADLDNTKPLVQSWLVSRGHRRNILGNYNLTGIGVAHDENGRVYVTQIFVRTGVS